MVMCDVMTLGGWKSLWESVFGGVSGVLGRFEGVFVGKKIVFLNLVPWVLW